MGAIVYWPNGDCHRCTVRVSADAYAVSGGRRISVDFKHGDGSLICCTTYDDTIGAITGFTGQMDKAFQALTLPAGAAVEEVVFAVRDSVSQTVLDAVTELNRRIMAAAPSGRFSQPPVRVIARLGGGF